MAKKATKKMTDEKVTKPVRLDLTIEDHERLGQQADRYGLSKAAYARMALFERMEADERRAAK